VEGNLEALRKLSFMPLGRVLFIVGLESSPLSASGEANYYCRRREHQNFSESTEEIAPLTEEEKKAKLEELRLKRAEKRARQAQEDKEENKKNEVCFRIPHNLQRANLPCLSGNPT
jgi:hypothetical protein